MIGNNHSGSAMIERPLRIVCRENAFDYDRAFPERTNPLRVVPGEYLALHRSVRITNPQYTCFRADDIGHVGKAAVEEKARQPTWTSQNLRGERDPRSDIAPQKLLHSVTQLALSVSDDGRIDRYHEEDSPITPCGFLYTIGLVKDGGFLHDTNGLLTK